MRQEIIGNHAVDEHGNPAGGLTTGTGIRIDWQNGPLGNGITEPRKLPNGAFVEGVIDAAINRLQFYQSGKFACMENAEAILHLARAARVLAERTSRREARAVEGTHTV